MEDRKSGGKTAGGRVRKRMMNEMIGKGEGNEWMEDDKMWKGNVEIKSQRGEVKKEEMWTMEEKGEGMSGWKIMTSGRGKWK